MKIRIKKIDSLTEESGTSAIAGFGAPIGDAATIAKFNKDQEEDSRLKDAKLEEMYSSQATPGVGIPSVSAEDELAGRLERDKARFKERNEDEEKEISEKLQEIQQFRKKMLRNLQK
jgi:hypothetical protein